MICNGFVHKYGDHIDTDAIIPARMLNSFDPGFLAAHCMEDIDDAFTGRVKPGDIMVGGLNFGCGSSREHAPIALKASGISCVIAENFARIFFRNAINIGLPVMECPDAAKDAEMGDRIEADLDTGVIKNLTKGKSYTAVPFPAFMQEIIAAGGLVAHTKAKIKSE
ncbi:MAG: 3-isopropylmalate dehydratase small subunit [Oscillospiraceae bacterium]|jgi:3-isopropylmalate/(R)-2-methylmalate dehydratase small subunit|nr:3-isopropylmalate dehydratase small subunit [Oscillospiraceae bacterium]